VVALGLAKRHDKPVGFWEFPRYGRIVTAVTIAVAAVYVGLRYL